MMKDPDFTLRGHHWRRPLYIAKEMHSAMTIDIRPAKVIDAAHLLALPARHWRRELHA
jgi:hypothetical protein